MTRRLLGPVGGPIAFVLIAGLVFTGLGWVTVAALRVEDAQRESAARAEVAGNLRLALWRLDGRMLPALAGENARPFLEYAAPDPDSPYGPTCGPLLAGPVPDWMRLHCQLDAEVGWASPQVLTPEAADSFRAAWPELQLLNATPDRARTLDGLKVKHPPKITFAAFAGRDSAPPPEVRRLAETAPPRMPMPAPPGINGVTPRPAGEPVRIEGKAEREAIERQQKQTDANAAPAPPAPAPPPRPAPAAADVAARGLQRGENPSEAEARRRAVELVENGRLHSNYLYPLPNNTQSFRGQNGNEAFQNGFALGRFATNPINPTGPADRDGRYNKADEKGAAGSLAFAPPAASRSSQPAMKAAPQKLEGVDAKARAEPSLGALVDYLARGWKDAPAADAQLRSSAAEKSKSTGGALAQMDRTKDQYHNAAPGGPPQPAGAPRGTAGGGFGGGVGGAGVPAPASAPAPGIAGPVAPGPVAGAMLAESKAGPGAPMAKMAKLAPPAAPPADPKAAGPAVATGVPMALAAKTGDPQPPTPDPVPPPVLVPAEPVALRDAPGAFLADLAPPAVAVHLGPIRPQWLTAADGSDTLVLVRTARLDGRTVYQGIVLDWQRLQEVLRDDVKDLFPDAKLVPVKGPGDVPSERAMTALPVQLDPGPAATPPPAGWTPLRFGLALAWGAALIAFGAIGLAGWSLIDLSERRIRFVSAVTHELRTPLTSLRLYLDLLLSGMVQDEAKRTEYLSTLATESDRLHRLIDNVLDFARLERRRSGSTLHPAKVADLLATVRDTWSDRCGTDGKELIVVSTLPPEAEVTTDAALVGQIVGNLIDNARKYTRGASDPRVWVWAKPEGRRVVLEVEDRGPGVPPRERNIIFRPFRRGEGAETTAGGAGLGLALCRQWAESLGGTLTYRPADGDTGACFRLELPGK